METLYKVFVGNVPFSYNMKDFKECFENVPGFIKAEIVCKPNCENSRGFGFVTLDSENNMKNLIGKTDIQFKDRILRFTEYSFQEKNEGMVENLPVYGRTNYGKSTISLATNPTTSPTISPITSKQMTGESKISTINQLSGKNYLLVKNIHLI
jgi:hypothetical protein